ncbi:hypothetical protein D3C86_1964780 [compost metagenome]
MQSRDADGRIGLVHRAVGLDAKIVLQPARAGNQRGRPFVAGAGVDLIQFHHVNGHRR